MLTYADILRQSTFATFKSNGDGTLSIAVVKQKIQVTCNIPNILPAFVCIWWRLERCVVGSGASMPHQAYFHTHTQHATTSILDEEMRSKCLIRRWRCFT